MSSSGITIEEDMLKALSNTLKNLGLGFKIFIIATTDDANSMKGFKTRLIDRINRTIFEPNYSFALGAHRII